MKLESLIKEIKYVACVGPCRAEVSGVVCDSRHVRPGSVFVAVAGHAQDGWQYAEDAVKRGAVAVISEHEPGGWPEICEVRVKNARRAAGRLAAAFHGHPSSELMVIGVTGTNGKTTTAYMVRDILKRAGRCPGLISTVAYEIGERSIPAARTTPEAPLLQSMLAEMKLKGCRSAVMEVSSHALVQDRVEGIEFDVGVFTNLTHDHLDYHKDMEQYFEAKRRLFLSLGRKGSSATAVVNRDDPWGRRLLEGGDLTCSVLTYGLEEEADVRAESISLTPQGSTFMVCTPWGDLRLKLDLLGRFNISNALAAVAACGVTGVTLKESVAALQDMTRVPGRLEQIRSKSGIQVFVDYAHTDDALENVLKTLREITPGRLLVVFGCGGDRDTSKRSAMGAVACRLADYSVLTSDNPRREDPADIIAQISKGFETPGRFEIVEDRREAIAKMLGLAKRGDVVLVAGKGHENFQEFADKTIPFDDRKVVRDCLGGEGRHGRI